MAALNFDKKKTVMAVVGAGVLSPGGMADLGYVHGRAAAPTTTAAAEGCAQAGCAETCDSDSGGRCFGCDGHGAGRIRTCCDHQSIRAGFSCARGSG